VNLYEFEKAVSEYENKNEKTLKEMIIPGEIISELYPVVLVKKAYIEKISHGSPIYYEYLKNNEDRKNKDKFCIFEGDKFMGIYNVTAEGKIFARPEFVLQEIK